MNQDTIQRTDPFADQARQSASPPVKTPFPDTGASGMDEVKKVAREQAHETSAAIQRGATEALDSAKESGIDFIQDQKGRLAGILDEYTQAVKAACQSLEGEDHNPLAGPAQRASTQMERASKYLRATDPVDILHDFGDFAKRKPELVFGGMFVAGLASVRFLKASGRQRRHSGSGSVRDLAISGPQFDSPRPEPFAAPAPDGPPPAYQTTNPSVLP